jgi:hypothetical protein
MTVRDYTEADLRALEVIHQRQGLDYPFPDLTSPLFDTKLVAESADGVIEQGLLLRITCEAYLLIDPHIGTPKERWGLFQSLHAAAAKRAWQRGFDDVHAYVPPEIERHFAKRLKRLGWHKDKWQSYFRPLEASDG